MQMPILNVPRGKGTKMKIKIGSTKMGKSEEKNVVVMRIPRLGIQVYKSYGVLPVFSEIISENSKVFKKYFHAVVAPGVRYRLFSKSERTISFRFNNINGAGPIPMDVTPYIRAGQNEIIINNPDSNNSYDICLNMGTFADISTLMQQAQQSFPTITNWDFDDKFSMVCPITKVPMACPARGKMCHHNQCFELEGFLRRAVFLCNWKCPICGNLLKFGELLVGAGSMKSKSAGMYPRGYNVEIDTASALEQSQGDVSD